jgi:hypothetical protein
MAIKRTGDNSALISSSREKAHFKAIGLVLLFLVSVFLGWSIGGVLH